MTDKPELPQARIVDRETGYEKASRIGLAIVGAVFTMWSELLLVLAAGIVTEAAGHWKFHVMVLPATAAIGGLGFVLVRRIVRPEMMWTSMKSGRLYYPSTSWAHAVFDLGYLALGVLMILPSATPAAEDYGFLSGIATVTLTGALFILRIVFWRRQRDLD